MEIDLYIGICLNMRVYLCVWYLSRRAGQMDDLVIDQEVRDYLSLTVSPQVAPAIFVEMLIHWEEKMKYQMKCGGGWEVVYNEWQPSFFPRL